MCQKLDVRLHTYVMDWPTMKELQRAYLLSGVANLDVPQDHLFCAAIYQMARKYRVKYILNGSNIATEGADAPFSLQHTYRDAWHLKSIYRKHGRGKSLKKYPALSLWEAWMGLPGVTKINLLNYVPYSKKEAIETLSREFDWEYYGGKHFESRFTKYFQSVYLPRKFGYDKRRAHLSCLILNGEMTREEALAELARPPYPLSSKRRMKAISSRSWTLIRPHGSAFWRRLPRRTTRTSRSRSCSMPRGGCWARRGWTASSSAAIPPGDDQPDREGRLCHTQA